MGSNRYLFGEDGVPPCIGEYEPNTARCFDCSPDDQEACIEQQRLNEVSHRDYRHQMRRIERRPLSQSRLQPQHQPQHQPQRPSHQHAGGVTNVHHQDFEPFDGESRAARFFKNVGLDVLVTAASSLATFARDFQWMPTPPKPKQAELEVVYDQDDDDEEVA